MDRGKFYQLAESYKRVDRISIPTNQQPQDIFVNIPSVAEVEPELKETGYSTAAIRRKELSNSPKVDDRVRYISEMAERAYIEQRRKEMEEASELAKKNERDAILIPYRVKKIKEENITAQQRQIANYSPLLNQNAPLASMKGITMDDNKKHANTETQPTPELYVGKFDKPQINNPLLTSTEKYLYGKQGVPLTRDFVIPTLKKDFIENNNAKRLKEYINEKKIKEKHYIPHNFVGTEVPNSNNVDKGKQERISQYCAKLVASAKFKVKRGQIDSVLSELGSAIGNGIKHADVFYMFGEVSRLKGLYQQSVKYLTEALRFKLHSPYTYFSLGRSYSALSEHEKAVKILEHFLELIEVPEAHFELAKSLLQLENKVESVIHITRDRKSVV